MSRSGYSDDYDGWASIRYRGAVKSAINGKPMPPAAALAYLHTEKARGHKVIPCSAQCGNPCKHPSCAGFDYAGGGCPGRLTTPPLRQEMT